MTTVAARRRRAARRLALCAYAAASIPLTVNAACAAARAADCEAVRREAAGWLPDVRIDDARVDAALSAPAHRPCRSLALVWRASNTAAASDGRVEFVHQSACRNEVDLRPPVTLAGKGVLVVALDRDRTLLWWRAQADPRDVHVLRPYKGTPGGQPHVQRVRAGAALFDVPIPADVRIDALELYEARRDDRSTPVMLGRVEVPPR